MYELSLRTANERSITCRRTSRSSWLVGADDLLQHLLADIAVRKRFDLAG